MKKDINRISKKILCFLLSIAIIAVSLPLSIVAQEIDEILNDLSDNATIGEKGIFELEEARTETTKTFRLEDGSYYVAQYDTQIHYLDELGEWQNIDNTLHTAANSITTSEERIKFAKSIHGNEEIFTLHNGNKKLSLSLDGALKKTAGVIKNNQPDEKENLTELQKMTTLDNIPPRLSILKYLTEWIWSTL